MERIILIPEPSITDIRREDWAIDRPAMLEHYNKVFAGMSAEQVIELLETEEAPFKFVSDSEIQFAAEKSFFPPLASYGCLVRIAFIDGMFNEAVDVSMCGVTV